MSEIIKTVFSAEVQELIKSGGMTKIVEMFKAKRDVVIRRPGKGPMWGKIERLLNGGAVLELMFVEDGKIKKVMIGPKEFLDWQGHTPRK
ncbi:MAG: hypothetical protein EXS55_04525 [Candidatus Magasanikbacteria bacterium]|nr:hypothetical protein [Candidatus Magasanikbacteria bacterium]